jgi:hypothetical protein
MHYGEMIGGMVCIPKSKAKAGSCRHHIMAGKKKMENVLLLGKD